MLTIQRKHLILERLGRDGQVIAKQLSQEFGLSEDTIRRDLRELAQEGRLQHVHGGALSASPAVVDFAGRQTLSTEGKAQIGRTAASLIRDGQVVVEVILIGGRLFKHAIVSVDAVALDAIQRLRADVFFMGVTGVHPEAGLTTGDLEEAYIKSALSQRAAETYVLASSEKPGAASPFLIMPLTDATGLIVEPAIPDTALAPFPELGLLVVK
jgi:DeoR/GlpR family transcriptional regulator of sugar metabolism